MDSLRFQGILTRNKNVCEKFHEETLMQHKLMLFGWMTKRSLFLQVIHYPTRFVGLGAVMALWGKAIGFIGVRDAYGNQLCPVKLPPMTSCEWKEVELVDNLHHIGCNYVLDVKND